MKKFLATAGVALLMSAPAAAYAADTTPEIKATSASRQTSSEANVGGTWAVDKLAVGQSFTVSTVSNDGKAPFTWNASFPLTLDDGSVVGECNADQATLTCKVTESYKDKVNGLKLEATATIHSNGGTDGDGSVKPTPAPSDEPTPAPTRTPCTIHPNRDKDRVPCKIEPVPVPTKTTPKPAPTIEAPKAKTGAASEAAVIGILSLLFGTATVAVAWFVGRYGTTR